jgi:hypothetical protein
MGFRMGIELSDDVAGHGYKWEDLTGQALIVTIGDSGEDVQGHGYKWEDTTGEDVEGHGYKWIRVDVDDTEGHGYKWEDLTGEAVKLKLEAGDEVEGRVRRVENDDDTKGHGYRW